MKQVNFIEAIKYANQGKKVYSAGFTKKFYLVIEINNKTDVEVFIKDEEGNSFINIEFYLNKWSVENE